jgi:hypothetical protein
MLYYRAWTSHAATLAPITIEVVYFDGCPNHEKLVTHLPQLFEREGITAGIVLRNIPDTDSAIQERFLGSPTAPQRPRHRCRRQPARRLRTEMPRIRVERRSGADPPRPSLGAQQLPRGLLQSLPVLTAALRALCLGQST